MPSRNKPAPLPASLVELDPPLPAKVVQYYPNPFDILRAYVEAKFQTRLAIEHERTVALIAAEGCDVADADSLARVEARLVDVATHRKTVEGFFKPLKDFAWKVHRLICDREAQVLAPLSHWDMTARGNLQEYRRADERRRIAEEQRLQDEARQAEQERLQAEAALLEARGEPELAATVLEQAVSAPAPVVVLPSTLPVNKQVTYRSNWQWRPLGGDTPANRLRAEKLIPREYLELSDRKIRAHVKAHGDSIPIPGLEIFDQGSTVVRT